MRNSSIGAVLGMGPNSMKTSLMESFQQLYKGGVIIPLLPRKTPRLRMVRSLRQGDPVRRIWILARHLARPYLSREPINLLPCRKVVGRNTRISFTHPVLELVGILVFLLVEVNEIMGDPLQVTVFHGPGDTERVTSDIIDLDAVGGGQQFHVPLWFGSCGD